MPLAGTEAGRLSLACGRPGVGAWCVAVVPGAGAGHAGEGWERWSREGMPVVFDGGILPPYPVRGVTTEEPLG